MGSFGEKFELYLISTYLFEIVAECLRETNINFHLSLMFIWTLTTLKIIFQEGRNGNRKGNGRGVQIG